MLSSQEWQRVDASVGRSLAWMAAQQQPDGSFPTLDHGQPAITSLCVLAFMVHGHVPGDGKYGLQLERAIEFVVRCQRRNGLLALAGPDEPEIPRDARRDMADATAYNHAIGALTLSEVYGMSGAQRAKALQPVIEKALAASLTMQQWTKNRAVDRGGWRYVNHYDQADSDVSITGWELMFLRSARNAGFDVRKEPIDEAVDYIRRSFNQGRGSFGYALGVDESPSRGSSGAGILALAHAGFHNSEEAQQAGKWILERNFDAYNQPGYPGYSPLRERYHYSLLMCCQAMYQLGGPMWQEFYPRTVKAVLANQQPDGSWPADHHQMDSAFGTCYTTALVVISLGAPNQLLPVFQR
ncbi:MAG: prenyltransferase/squalene oxidase repeat-containing protein [Pirellulales bacterium]